MDLKQGKMKMIDILNDLTFDDGFCEICSEHGDYTV